MYFLKKMNETQEYQRKGFKNIDLYKRYIGYKSLVHEMRILIISDLMKNSNEETIKIPHSF